MPRIPEGVIDQILTRVDIVELIGRYVSLKLAGRHHKARCPFHEERTPSFMVNAQKQIFHCFGCHAGGNVFSFLMRQEGITFPEAVRQLADELGVQIPETSFGSSQDETSKRLAELIEKSCSYFERVLQSSTAGDVGRRYLKQRGVSEKTSRLFRLGMASGGWENLIQAAKGKGFEPGLLEKAGLAIQGRSGYYDRFRERLIFPLSDTRGRILGFGGRSLEDQEPKYLNSPETVLYQKSRQLFGLVQARQAISSTGYVIIVEGYFDCIVLAEAGLRNVVAPLGTALTSEQVQLLRRYTDRVVLAFDADVAGEQATLRGIERLVEAGIDVSVASLDLGQDPDDTIRKEGLDGFEKRLKGARSVCEFLLDHARRRFPGDSIAQRVLVARSVLSTIARMPSALVRSESIRSVARRLDLDEHALAQELHQFQSRGQEKKWSVPDNLSGETLSQSGPVRILTALVLDDPMRLESLDSELLSEFVTDRVSRRILEVIDQARREGQRLSPSKVVARLEEAGFAGVVSQLVEEADHLVDKEAAFSDCRYRLQELWDQQKRKELQKEIQDAQEAGRDFEVKRLVEEYQRRVKEHCNR